MSISHMHVKRKWWGPQQTGIRMSLSKAFKFKYFWGKLHAKQNLFVGWIWPSDNSLQSVGPNSQFFINIYIYCITHICIYFMEGKMLNLKISCILYFNKAKNKSPMINDLAPVKKTLKYETPRLGITQWLQYKTKRNEELTCTSVTYH